MTARAPSPAAIRELIVAGQLTRERACDGKARFNSYDKAIRARDRHEAEDGRRLEAYACPFCTGFHLASHLLVVR